MAINLKDFETEIEYRLPIIVLIDESGFDNVISMHKYSNLTSHSYSDITIPSMAYMAAMVEKLNEELIVHNIRGALAVISYGDKVSFRYPVLKEDESPRFCNIEDIDCNQMCSEIIKIQQSKTSVLGTALKLTKAIVEDEETMNFECYNPMIIVMSAGQPSYGWEEAFSKYMGDGKSKDSKVFYLDMNSDTAISASMKDKLSAYANCQIDNDTIWRFELASVAPHRFIDYMQSATGISGNSDKYNKLKKVADINSNEKIFKKENNTMCNTFGRHLYYAYEIVDSRGKTDRQAAENEKKKFNDAVRQHDSSIFYLDVRDDKAIFNGTSIIKDFVSKFTYDPMEKAPTEIKVELPMVDIPTDIGEHGDNPNAVGNGYI